MKYKKITIIVITYNQEGIVGRCLDSILCQREYGLKDIIICDDCSTDNNWNVIQEYKRKYSDVIRAYRNDHNKGIYGNLQQALTYIESTDLIQMCSGDDAFCLGYFNTIQNFIIQHDITNFNEKFVIYSDWKTFTTESKEYVHYNNYISKGYSAISLKLRQLIGNRSTFLSYSTIKSFNKVPVNEGVSVAENLFDCQTQIHSDYNYYCPFIGTIYYSGIGVSTKMNTVSHIKNLILSYERLRELGIYDKKDLYYINYKISRLSFIIDKSVILFLKTWYYYFKSIRYKLDLKFICRDFLIMIIKCIYSHE